MSAERDPYVGFDGYLPLFVEEVVGGTQIMRTARNKLGYFNDQRFAAKKPPGAFRIFCLGGSTTYGHPWDDEMSFCGWLRRFLVALAPERRWEVVNAGGISYASYRVAALMEELSAYQPDLFIVYSGHNEFLEERSYREIRAIPPLLVEANAVLGHSRVFTAIANTLATASEPIRMSAEVSDRLSKTIGPVDYHRDDATSARIGAHFRFNLERMVRLARAAGSEIAFVMPASNEQDMAPFKSESSLPPAAAADWLRRFEAARAITAPADRLVALDALLGQDPRYAEAQFERGKALMALNRPGEARLAFGRAIDEDVVPLRMPSNMGRALRALAAQAGVPLIDFPALLEARNREQLGHPVLGREWFPDHVHLTVEGYRLLGLALLQAMKSHGMFDRPIDERVLARASEEALKSLDAETSARALINLGVVMGWAGRLEEGHRLLLDARDTAGDNLNILLRLGYSSKRMGKTGEARDFFTRALAMNPNSTEAHRQLGDIAKLEGDREAELQHRREAARRAPTVPGDIAALAHLLAERGDWDEAAQAFRTLAALVPADAQVRSDLGVALARAGQHEAAREALGVALALDEARPDTHLALAGLAEDAGDPDTAERHYRRAVEAAPGDAVVQLNLGAFLANRGQVRGALPHFREAVRLEPGSLEARLNLAMALRQDGREDEAQLHFEAARGLGGGR